MELRGVEASTMRPHSRVYIVRSGTEVLLYDDDNFENGQRLAERGVRQERVTRARKATCDTGETLRDRVSHKVDQMEIECSRQPRKQCGRMNFFEHAPVREEIVVGLEDPRGAGPPRRSIAPKILPHSSGLVRP
jgi:hypothetical protein